MVVYYVLLAHQRWQLIKRKNIPRRLRFSVRASTAVQFYMIYLTNFHKKISKCKVEISRKLPMNMCALRDGPFELLTSLLPPSGQLEHERRPRGAEKLPTDCCKRKVCFSFPIYGDRTGVNVDKTLSQSRKKSRLSKSKDIVLKYLLLKWKSATRTASKVFIDWFLKPN